ncbi:aldo/keto reductase [Falsiroseomonas selenitidurans]|uniref:Aldo/keto reductase n=1 Tax=Falsiroseomonas selenitidurans TaxID=2716335 RepID=A0ABX1EG31_9PROT|nr:aldo/keto reductase [Falsiroseomonas selenitidurans]NKC33850.1 aldo/keto reductase [Falsiroseomonas selenitidurans]
MTQPILETPHLRMPRLGLGTWPMKGAECSAAVQSALALGYRHIDTAEMYGNEDAVGAGIAASDVPREDIFLTTKIWNDKPNGAAIRSAFDASLKRLATPYVDLLLIHWPSPELDLPDALAGLAAIRAEGRAKAIGVSNFPPKLLQRAIDHGVGLAALQVECHALLDQSRLLEICRANGMVLTAYSPLGKGQAPDQPVLQQVAKKHGATAAQVALAWLLAQPGVAMVPKAASRARQAENLAALELALDAADLAAIAALPKDRRFVNPGMAPDWVNG